MSCFGGQDELIYLVEVLVHKLNLSAEKIKDIGEHPVAIKIKFLHFPPFEVTREDFYSLRPPPMEEDGTMHFMIGRSCLFIMQPKDLVRELQSTTVKVGVFRVGDTYPTAETEITLPGCLCDQIAMVQNDAENLPKPFSVKSIFHLVDPGENPAGTLDMELRLTCFGRSTMTHYEMHPKFFVFRNHDKEREFCVRRLMPSTYYSEGKYREVTDYSNRTTMDDLTEKPEPEVKEEDTKGKKGKEDKKKDKEGKDKKGKDKKGKDKKGKGKGGKKKGKK